MVEDIGYITIGALLLASILVVLEIALNIVCSAIGAVRLRRVVRAKTTWAAVPWIARKALSGWYGPRYNGHCGKYVQVGGLEVPLDIRDPIRGRRYDR